MMARLFLLAWLVGACAGAPVAPAIPAARPGTAATFADEAALHRYLVEASRARPPSRVEHGVISEPGSSYAYTHVDPRVRPHVDARVGPSVVAASSTVLEGEVLWTALEQNVVRASVGTTPVPAQAERFGLPAGAVKTTDAALLRVDGIAAMFQNRCGGIDIARAPFASEALQICGRLATLPQLFAAGDDVIFYGAFDAIGEDDASTAIELPTVRVHGQAARTIVELGPVYYPAARVADVFVRVVLRCDRAFSHCAARSFVSPRSAVDALWIDTSRIAMGFGDAHGHSTVIQLPSDGAPTFTSLDRWVIGLAGLSDGRLAVVRSGRAVNHPRAKATPMIAVLDRDGHVEPGPAMPAPVAGREGSWRWEIHGDQFVYGPSRTHGLGGADVPRIITAEFGASPVDIQPLTTSVDAILFDNDESIAVGATEKGVATIVRRASGHWTEHPYSPPWSLKRTGGLDQAARAMLQTVDGRRVVVVPYRDMTYVETYTQTVLELRDSEVVELGRVACSPLASRTVHSSDDTLGAFAVGHRLVLRMPGELVVLELDASAIREVGRISL